MTFRIAHVSDLHVLSHTGAQWRAMLFNKRITGYANTVGRRGRVHRREFLVEVLDAASKGADHVVVTGDITNLALESEYEDARSLLETVARRVEVTVVPAITTSTFR
ncbi:MAG: metallophosphoesterase family protein, partial [Thermoanaerobaculia bacterium]